jgi:PhoH-like ATPase
MKYYILDTNILLDNPDCIYKFDDNMVILTEATIEELDKFKKGKLDINISAREVIRNLNYLRQYGSLHKGIKIDDKFIKVESNYYNTSLPENWDRKNPDNRILQVAKGLSNEGKEVVIITKDMNMKIKADILDIPVEEYKNEKTKEKYTGRIEIYISDFYIDNSIKDKKIKIEDIKEIYKDDGCVGIIKFHPNEYVLIRSIENNNKSLMGKVSKDCEYIEYLLDELHPYGITGKNIGQKFAIDALMRDVEDIPLVIIQGGSGTGKDFITLACGLEKTFNANDYRKILITREIQTLGKDLGTLPGTEEEKLDPFLRGFIDNLEALIDNDKDKYKNEKELSGKVQYLFDTGIIKAEAISYMRGRSIYKQFIIIDEAQNCSINQMKGILTRIAEDTKIVLLGDTKQIDNIYLDENTNGLSWASELMKDSPYCCQITLKDSESVRSNLVKDILNRL